MTRHVPMFPSSTLTGGRFELPEAMPEDFALVFKYGVGAKNTLDTFVGTFVKDMIFDPSVQTKLALTPEELGELYRRMREIDMASYPRTYYPKDPGTTRRITPFTSYYIRIRANGAEKEVSWEDETQATRPDAAKLRELCRWLIGVIQAKDEYRALPAAKGGYI